MSDARFPALGPWGSLFIEALIERGESRRLSRGLEYAAGGRVLELSASGGLVRARVAGRSKPFYSVSIVFRPLSPLERRRICSLLDERPELLGRVSAGESPPELLDLLTAEGIDLGPRGRGDMRRSCDCPDFADPCKHMAAACYALALKIDADPRLLFRLRGLELSGYITENRPELPSPQRRPAEGSPEPRAIPSYLGLILSLTPPHPSFAPQGFPVLLAAFYHLAARKASESGAAESRGRERNSVEAEFSRCDYSTAMDERGADFRSPRYRRRLGILARPPHGAARPLSLTAAAALFSSFSSEEGSEGYRFLFRFFRRCRELIASSAFAPFPVAKGSSLTIEWGPAPCAKEAREALRDLAAVEPGLFPGEEAGEEAVEALAEAYLSEWVRALDFRALGEGAMSDEVSGLFFRGARMGVSSPAGRALAAEIRACLSAYAVEYGRYRYRLGIREAKGGEARFALSLSVLPPGEEGQAAPPLGLREAGLRFGPSALRGPLALSAYLPRLRELSRKKRILVDEESLSAFLSEARRLLERLRVEVVLPKALRRALDPRLILAVETKSAQSLAPSLGLDSLLSFRWKVALGEELMEVEDFIRLVEQKLPVVRFRDRYARLDPAQAASLLERYRRGGEIGPLDLAAARASGDAVFSADAQAIVSAFFAEPETPIPQSLNARLRPYQERGYRWAYANFRRGFGCIIADDMGLGKTVEAIAVMLRLKEEGLLGDGVLVVAPAALLTNWERELARFSPGLSVRSYHGPGRSLAGGADVRLTTYQTALRDEEKLAARPFSLIVADEAHLMKNALAKRTRALKSLSSAHRLALSGTPVENRLEDLRSIFDFALPGYLGARAAFTREWRRPIELEGNKEKAEKLKRITAPFLLRRLKTDKSVIDDLPEKNEIDEYARLSPAQAGLYGSVVAKGMEDARRATRPEERGAIILRLILSLKQICDHPRVYDKESPAEASLSGKCLLLLSLLDGMLPGDEKVLVFSQYVETLRLLQAVLRKERRIEALLYHGGMPQEERDETVGRFQDEAARRVMLVSLRAGGLGLNLTAASRVIHFDLWFNPAVESQATDRAFRIGQTKNVFVHRFITAGTFEEKLDAMIKSKRELAEMSVSSGESWLCRMSDEEIKAILS